MKTLTPKEFAERVMGMAEPSEPFESQVTYNPDGDCIEFIASPDNFYAERVDGLVTVYYSERTGQVIGSLIKGVRSFCDRMLKTNPGFGIEIRDGKVRLKHLFLAHLWNMSEQAEDITVITYEKLGELADKVDATAELCEA